MILVYVISAYERGSLKIETGLKSYLLVHGSRFKLNVTLLEKYKWQSFEAVFRKTELIVQEES